MDKHSTPILKIMAAGIVLGAFMLGIKMFLAPNVDRAYHWTRGNSFSEQAQAAAVPPLSEGEFSALLRQVHDPELNINIIDLGLIYRTAVEGRALRILMTLTTPSCPYGGMLIDDVKKALFSHPAVHDVELTLTFDPPWSIDRISPDTRAKLLGTVPSHIHAKGSS